jgi:hypothetical protein
MVYGGGLILGIIAFCTFWYIVYGVGYFVIRILPDIIVHDVFKRPRRPRPATRAHDTDFVAVRERITNEQAKIGRAMQTDPSDPALLRRIEKLTEEVESIDRRVVEQLNEQARLPFNELVAGRPPKHPSRHYPER